MRQYLEMFGAEKFDLRFQMLVNYKAKMQRYRFCHMELIFRYHKTGITNEFNILLL